MTRFPLTRFPPPEVCQIRCQIHSALGLLQRAWCGRAAGGRGAALMLSGSWHACVVSFDLLSWSSLHAKAAVHLRLGWCPCAKSQMSNMASCLVLRPVFVCYSVPTTHSEIQSTAHMMSTPN